MDRCNKVGHSAFQGLADGGPGGYISGRLLLYGDPGSAALALIDLEICTSEGAFFFFFFKSSTTSCSFPLWRRQRCYEITRRMSGRSSARVVSQTTLRHFGPRQRIRLRDASSPGNRLHYQTGEEENFFHLSSHCLTLWVDFLRKIQFISFFVLIK